jgi:hypothetical protein
LPRLHGGGEGNEKRHACAWKLLVQDHDGEQEGDLEQQAHTPPGIMGVSAEPSCRERSEHEGDDGGNVPEGLRPFPERRVDAEQHDIGTLGVCENIAMREPGERVQEPPAES